ncbi:receptor-type tyrosine-protein phosphatase S-like isoform X12 [Etheostoma cragini]|uniref:receptor-type tyrosine-protein phosphatase S-like isoform X12 n=1 Tax=Etheostoma cragini TaxID=417921 RepID=UPI00155F1CC9|nr:receptor-type tyrosine-protein phosphatase S-like isoform X12 [Etheostoma cragini]
MPLSRTGGVQAQSRRPILGLRLSPSALHLLLPLIILLTNPLSILCGELAPPKFNKIPTDQIGVSGGVASFVCQATGNPKPVVYWNKKGKKVNSQRIEVTVEFDEGAGAVLRIQPLRAPRDENIYECVARNSEGEVSVTAKLAIIREDLLPLGFPSIDMGPQLKVVERTKTATMLCAASGIPDPEISWFKDFLPVEPFNSQGRIKQLRSGALQIENSEETDQGKYECVATNSRGVRYSSPANLYVRVRRVPPRFSILPSNHEIMPGGSINITCVAVGSPMPYVKWMLGSEDLTPEDEMPIGRNVLELNGVRESANYTCVAMSSLGILEATAQVLVKTLPKPPGTPIVTETTATSVTITWDSGNPDPVSYYIIQYRAKGPDSKYETVDSITTTRYSIGGLYPNTEYEIRVSAFNSIGQGPPSTRVEARTGEQAPASPPRNVQAHIISPNTVMVRWEEPEEPNGQVKGYRVYYTMDPSRMMSEWQIHNVQDSLITTIQNLVTSETYTIQVLAFTSVGDGPFSDPVHVKVMPGVPGQPGKFKVGKVADTSIELTWEPAYTKEGIVNYELLYKPVKFGSLEKLTFGPRNSYTVEGLKANTEYSFSLAAISNKGIGAFTNELVQRTSQANVPRNFSVNLATKTSVLLTWEFPESSNPYRFTVEYNRQKMEVDARLRKAVIPNLQPDTSYDFKITAPEGNMGGLRHRISAKTSPPITIRRPEIDHTRDTETTVTIILPSLETRTPVKNVYVVVVPLKRARGVIRHLKSPDEMDLEELLKDISQKQRDSRQQKQVDLRRAYITARFTPATLPAFFTLGDQLDYGGFENRALEPGQEYVFFILAELNSTTGKMYVASPYTDPVIAPDSDPQPLDAGDGLIWVVGPVLAVVFIICIVIAILLYKNSKPDSKRKDSEPGTKSLLNNAEMMAHHPTDPVEMRRINFQTPGMMSHPPIPISELAEHIELLKANDNLRLSQEYESIDPSQQFTWEHSNLEVNKPKNRYANVIAYDHTRVILAPIEGILGSDYLNANYIDGYRKQNAYIATQGPLAETFGDFWRMVWEQRAASVVMMTRLEEKSRIKCDQYWPSRGTETYGMIQVTLLDTMELATFCVRTLSLHKSGCSERREVRQFQFTAWPDHGVPEYPTPFLNFLRRVKACNPPDAGPIIAHCSAGVGRTGCFIVIDAMLERIRHERTVDIYGHVTLMRSQRNYMVQTEDQYSFIHEALLEAVACGNTEVAARSLYSYMQKLSKVEPGEHITGMELEFKIGNQYSGLGTLANQRLANTKAHTSRFVTANLPCNKFKNRLVNIMPYETTRVCLQPIRGLEGSDYINASYIDGYRQQKGYIATQGPLAETTEDFWRMLWEHNSTIVVMLTKLREMGRVGEKCHQYWPAERSARYQYFVVDPMAEYNMPQYILREFKVTDARDGQSRTVRQFQFTDWPEQGVPKSGEGFIDFIGQVHKTKEQFGQDGPISVHCSAGVGRTGVFITLSIVLERMRYEGAVDIFQTVKMLRTQRPAMVQTEDEYQFCYQAALEYLGSFDHYAT